MGSRVIANPHTVEQEILFLVIYKRACLSVSWSSGPLVCRSVCKLFFWRTETKMAYNICRVSLLDIHVSLSEGLSICLLVHPSHDFFLGGRHECVTYPTTLLYHHMHCYQRPDPAVGPHTLLDGWMDGQTEFLPILQDFILWVPLTSCLLATGLVFKAEKRPQ